jgi:Uma2 family endonuclease
MAVMGTDAPPQYPASFRPLGDEWTVDDLERLPDDGMRYELIDGGLLVSAAPTPQHQRAARGVFRLLDQLCPADCEVFFAPLDYRPDRRNSLEPDVLVVRRGDVGPRSVQGPPLLVVEVLSPSSRRRDQLLKRSVYEDHSVPAYWMFDPDGPSIVVCELVDGTYHEVSRIFGPDMADLRLPYPLQLCAATLAQG